MKFITISFHSLRTVELNVVSFPSASSSYYGGRRIEKSVYFPLIGLLFTEPLTAVILLSFVLALGFLLIILSCALWANWLPLLVGERLFLFLQRLSLMTRTSTYIRIGPLAERTVCPLWRG